MIESKSKQIKELKSIINQLEYKIERYNEYRASYQSQLFEYSEENKELHKLVNKMLKMERHEVAYLYMQYLENKIDGIRS